MINNISKILSFAIKLGASDIHMSVWKLITFRIEGNLKPIENLEKLDLETMKSYAEDLLENNLSYINKLYDWHDLDFAYMHESWTSFRVNWFYKLWKISFVIRLINSTVKTMSELWLPPKAQLFTRLKQGLVLITGPTWSWKSTTMISILNQINQTRAEHILTIEDPVEYVFSEDKCIFSQREIWRDTNSFKSALKSAMREDPNIIMIWEMRDSETVKAALDLAETGHLVISTLHTSSSIQTITRLINFFPLEHQNNIRSKIADNLEGILSQRLIPRSDKNWRIWIFELMITNPAIKNLIRSWNLNQLFSNIETWSKEGMITLEKYAKILESRWLIEKKDYINYFSEK
jgi:twitching motility protein PilT